MLRLRSRLYPWIERGVMSVGLLRVDDAAQWREFNRLVFVCTGNICRSPYAEFVAKGYGLSAISCGINTTSGLPADPMATAEAAKRQQDITSHRTTRWQDVVIEDGDIIVAMELRHALAALKRARREHRPVVVLSSLLPGGFDVIRDPYGRSQDEFSRVFDLIDRGVENIAGRLRVTAAK